MASAADDPKKQAEDSKKLLEILKKDMQIQMASAKKMKSLSELAKKKLVGESKAASFAKEWEAEKD